MPRKRTPRVADNIQLQDGKYRAQIMVDGQRRSKMSRDEQVVRDWLATQRAGQVDPLAGSFAADVARYLPTRAAAPTFNQITAHLELWLEVLGRDRPSRSVTTHDINLVIARWLKSGLASGTVRKRRGHLQTFFESIRPAGGTNPVWDAENPAGAKPTDRSLDYGVIAQVLAQIPTWRDVKKGTPKQPNLSKLRAAVIAYTGIPPGLLAKVKPVHLTLVGDEPHVQVSPRRKGGGTAGVRVYLTADGVAAFKDFHAANAYGHFEPGPLNVSFKRAAMKTGLVEVTTRPDGTTRRKATVHLYDLRHSVGAFVYATTRDLASVARALCHADGSTVTQRYAMGANKTVDVAVAKAVSAARSAARRATLKVVPSSSSQQTGS